MPYADVANLKAAHLKTGIDGKKWLIKPRQKTGITERVPLLPPALRIIQQYKDHYKSTSNGKLLPIPSN